MILYRDNYKELYDKAIALKCPHCNVVTGVTLISVPSFEYLTRYRPPKIGMGFMCTSCQEPVFLKFKVDKYDLGNSRIIIFDKSQQIELPKLDFEFEFVPEPIAGDLREALSCYSIGAFNGFAAMCRRTIQSSASEIGAKGKDKVQKQITDMKEIADIDEETFNIIKQIVLDGHDGSHPHLPALSQDRADILLELIKDIIYQLYVRKGKLKKAADLRNEQIQTIRN